VEVVLLGLLTGLAAGAVLARGTVCFNGGLRRAVFEKDAGVLRVFALAVAVQLLFLPLLVALGVGPLTSNVDAGPALLPVAQLAGGLVFGVGMALAGGCIVGIFWKAGSGSIAVGMAIAGFALGELLIRGPGESLIGDLDGVSRPAESSLHGLLGLPYAPVALALGALALIGLLRRRRDGLALGAGLGVVAGLAWVAADLSGYSFGLGFVGAAEGTREAVAQGGELPFTLFLAVGVLVGGAATLRGPMRRPDAARMARALAGGVLMGVGGSVAHGCNIGHGVTGAGLLTLGSLLAIAAMAAGALVTWQLLLRPFPGLRGVERPQPAGW